MSEIVAISLVKNEIDILPQIINHMQSQGISKFLIADNMSSDGTWEFLQELDKETFCVIKDEDPAHHQSKKINALMQKASKKIGTDFMVFPFDADEMFYSLDASKTLAETLKTMDSSIASATVYDFIPQPSDQQTGNPLNDITHKLPYVQALPSVAFKYHESAVIAEGNHSVSYQNGTINNNVIAVRHYQYRNFEHYVRKLREGAKALEKTGYDSGIGAHWHAGAAKSDEELLASWNAMISQPLIYEPLPEQM